MRFYFAFGFGFGFGFEEKKRGGFFLRLIFFGFIYILWKIFIRFGKKIEWNDFSEVAKEGFSVFIARRLKYDEAKERRGVIYSTYC